jgi:hypothetical protein
VEWLQSITKLPVLVKGILTAEDGKIFLLPKFSECDKMQATSLSVKL